MKRDEKERSHGCEDGPWPFSLFPRGSPYVPASVTLVRCGHQGSSVVQMGRLKASNNSEKKVPHLERDYPRHS